MSAVPVVYAIARMNIGGAQQHLLEVLARLDRRAFTPILSCLDPRPSDPFLARARGLDVEVIDGGAPESVRGAAMLRPVLRLAGELRRRSVAVVHSYLFHANVIGTLAARLARVPVALVSKRSLDVYPNRGERLACRLANRLATRVTANAEAVKRHVHRAERCPLERIVVIPNGIDFARVADDVLDRRAHGFGLPGSGPVVGTIGRLSQKKGQADFLAAAGMVLSRLPETRFVLVGDGPLAGELQRQAREQGIEDKVRFVGAVADGARLLGSLDVFVLPSHIEGMSNGLIEAMGAGLPIVATDAGGNAEVVADGQTGFIVPPRNPLCLAEALLTLCKDPERARAMGAAGRVRARERFTADLMVRRLEDLYRELLAARGVAA